MGGEGIEVNEAREGEPEKINTAPYGSGWIARVKVSGGSLELLDPDAYTTFLEE